MIGDATEDHSLLEAGIAHARGLVACLTNDPQNLFVTLSARSLNGQARIVSKVIEAENEPKMLKAGANTTVSPNQIGGVRLASELVRPKLIVALGRVAAQRLLDTDAPLSRLRGPLYHYGAARTPLLITYHPAYLLRSPREKAKSWDDLKKIHQFLTQPAPISS